MPKGCGCTATVWCLECIALAQRAGIIAPPEVSERALQAAVIRIAKQHGWLAYHTYNSKRSEPGFPDLVLAKVGRLLMAELKREKDAPTYAQTVWLDTLAQSAFPETHVWRPSDMEMIRHILAS